MKCREFRSKANHRIIIQKMSNTGDNYGGETVSWQTQSTVWADIQPLSGNELFRQDMQQSMVRNKMIIRYQSDLKDTALTGKYRVSYDGRLFPIKYITNLAEDMISEGKAYQILYCEENSAGEQ